MAKKDEQDAPVETAAQPTTPIVTDEAVAHDGPTTTVVTAPRSRNGLALAGVIGGGLVAAALLFGGGVAVGLALPGHGPGQIGTAQVGPLGQLGSPGGPGTHGGQPGIQGGPQRHDGERPEAPQQRESGTDSEAD